MILRNVIEKHDRKGYDRYLPFKYLSNSADVLVQVTNSLDYIKPVQYTLSAKSYQTLSEIVSQIVEHDKIKLSSVNFKIN